LVLIHVLSPDNKLHQKISDYVKTKCQLDTLKTIQYYYWTPGSHIPWHNDGNYNGGITVYLNKAWDEDWGGIFLYKDGDMINGFYPKSNRCIMQCGGIPHSVAPTSKNSDVRLTIQIFF
jgi:Rps23 Pro-64 3,4-dihydroxylase Tpa1-like proline 4-hydroxylase